MTIQVDDFKFPAMKYRVNPIIHHWPGNDRDILMDAVKAFGYGGVVTNPSTRNGFTDNPENIEEFKEILTDLDKRGLSYWIYDENGYPSGYAGGKTLEGHPEMEAKGFYMVRRIAYAPKHSTYHMDDESDKIVWAAKYPVDCTAINNSIIQFEKMEQIPFADSFVECDLKAYEALFIFVVKSCYEGSHCTHNVCSHSRYINIMDEKAVRRFIDICYEPIVDKIPDAYSRAVAVFTDEPSLQVGYIHGYEEWPYALAPWVDGLFEAYEDMYGESLKPWLPLLFEGQATAYPIRIKFYNLVGKLISRAYTYQLSKWCEDHGGQFSGHYIAEESILAHVKYYGNYIEVLRNTSYPGIDVLACIPEIYNYNTAKFPQLAAQKMSSNGMMVEICPFIRVPEFAENAIDNMTGVMNLLFMGGTRVTNSYFASDFASYDQEKLSEFKGYMNKDEANQFNEYVGRIAYMLDGIQNDCGTFVYYALEDVQAKLYPRHREIEAKDSDTDVSIRTITRMIYEAGYDYSFADREEIVKAAACLKDGKNPMIFGSVVETVIVPSVDVMCGDARAALVELKAADVDILFLDKLPRYDVESMPEFQKYDFRQEAVFSDDITSDNDFKAFSKDGILAVLHARTDAFDAKAQNAMILKARYNRDGLEMYFVVNNSRLSAEVLLNHREHAEAILYNPADGSTAPVRMDEKIKLQALRGVFVVFDR